MATGRKIKNNLNLAVQQAVENSGLAKRNEQTDPSPEIKKKEKIRKQMTLTLTKEDCQKIEVILAKKGWTFSAFIRSLIREHLDRFL